MPRNVKKENLPTKICVICNRPFNWRKKWERVWDEVSTCSKSCNHRRKRENQIENRLVQLENANMDVFHLQMDNLNVNERVIDGFDDLTNQDSRQDQSNRFDKMGKNLISIENEKEGMIFLDDLTTKNENSDSDCNDTTLVMQSKTKEQKEERKRAKKLMKAKRRAERQGKGDPTAGQKKCDICNKSVDLLIRCTTDQSKVWRMVCGKCWKDVSGGVVDGDSSHPHYCYGGLWKNRRAQK